MKKNHTIPALTLFLSLLWLAPLACGPGGAALVTPPPGAVETAQAAGQQGGSGLQTAAAVATTQGGNALATIQAIGTPNINALQEKLAGIQPDANGNFTVTITDDEVNQVILAQQQLAGNQQTALQNPLVTFIGGNIVLTGDVTQPIVAPLAVVFRPAVVDGVLQFELISATLGSIQVPETLLAGAESTLNSSLGQALNQMPAGVQLQEILMGEGTMTITGRQTQ
ncbi:MAG: DUF2993 domain-containing protein [Chloroflexi bacterium]|nr:DUF2993 domain-containing protein [Chloroflexota bacterium]MCI0575545.1 DUF2993 domain-containing protein [Chloroflexota bacterium]MCI0644085.1 DUF2993 domain-containing protein [Chloroflexota bacterium]MCI0727901.1 DUF2993 domain-containing protein [Chloroflexota bacterium]